MAAQTGLPHLTAEEVGRLQDGLPCLMQWSEALLVPFPAYRLRTASVAWVNRRWFLERGFDLTEQRTLHRISQWLLDEFAWRTPYPGECPSGDTRTLWADRYGSTSGQSQHGGSGRVATIGHFQAKGIGQTPLVGQGSREGHAHGCTALSESLREVIYSEVSAAEFPHSAVPVIAVLDTGLNFSSPDPGDRYEQNVRRGILIRPAVIRPAHAERAPLFKHTVGEFVNRHVNDAQRTRDVIEAWAESARDPDSETDGRPISDCLRAISEQIAFGQVQRLFSGGYFSSNVSISGELLDFGNAHALPNWANAWVLLHLGGFGDEMRLLPSLIGSLAYYFTKYRKRRKQREWAGQVIRVANDAYEQAWRRYCLALFQAERLDKQTQDAVHGSLRRYFTEQQRMRVIYRFGEPTGAGVNETTWLHDTLITESCSDDTLESRTLTQITAALRAGGNGDLYGSLSTAARLLMPRPTIDRRKLMDTLAAAVAGASGSACVDARTIEKLVCEAICAARRHWPRFPADKTVLAHATRHGSSALLLCTERRGEPGSVWLEGVRGAGTTLHWFGHRLEHTDFDNRDVQIDGAYWSTLRPVRRIGDDMWHVVLRDGEIALPRMDVWYRSPAETWLRPRRT